MPAAARILDFHSCPAWTGLVPHIGGPIAKGSTNVFTGMLPQARVGDMAVCVGPPDQIVKGSSGVFVNGMAAARQLDPTAHGGMIVQGLPTVIIGESGGGGGGGAALVLAKAAAALVAGGAAAPVSVAHVESRQQGDALKSAAHQGTPFVQPCFEPASAQPPKSLQQAKAMESVPTAKTQAAPAKAPTPAKDISQFKLGAGSEQRLSGVNKTLADVVRRAIQISKVDFTVVEGHRSQERQVELYAQGRTKPGKIVTKTLNSKHTAGKAVDLAPVRGGTIDWNDSAGFQAISEAMFAASAELGVPIDWGGSWKSFPDTPHFETP